MHYTMKIGHRFFHILFPTIPLNPSTPFCRYPSFYFHMGFRFSLNRSVRCGLAAAGGILPYSLSFSLAIVSENHSIFMLECHRIWLSKESERIMENEKRGYVAWRKKKNGMRKSTALYMCTSSNTSSDSVAEQKSVVVDLSVVRVGYTVFLLFFSFFIACRWR